MDEGITHEIQVREEASGRASLTLRRPGELPTFHKFHSMTAARIAEGKLNEAFASDCQPEPPTVREFALTWFEDFVVAACSEETGLQYRSSLENSILPNLGEVVISEVTPALVTGFRDRVLRERGFAAASMDHRVLSSMLGTAYKWGLLNKNPAARLGRGRG